MAGKAKVVLTDYVWESLDVEKKTLAGLADLDLGHRPQIIGPGLDDRDPHRRCRAQDR